MDSPPATIANLVTDDGTPDPSALDAMLARIKAQSDAFVADLHANNPQTAGCRVCGHPSELNEDASIAHQGPVYDCENCDAIRAQQKIGERIERAGIPSDVRHATLENFSVHRAGIKFGEKFPSHKNPAQFVEAAKQFLQKGKRNIIFAGAPGIGKGHLAAAIAIHFIKAHKWRVAWIECARLFRDYHKAYETGTTDEIAERLGAINLLVLDEICLRDLPADGEEILFAILDRRHKEGKPTIMLGNKPADDIRAWLGGRIVDRLRSGGVIFCYGEWESMRGQATDGSRNANEF